MHDIEMGAIKEVVSPNIINNFSINNMPFMNMPIVEQKEDKNYIIDSLACCLLYFCCVFACPINIVCGIYSYVLASNDTSDNHFIRLCIKVSLILSIIFFVCFLFVLIFSV